jgi:HlyD family secretion protein
VREIAIPRHRIQAVLRGLCATLAFAVLAGCDRPTSDRIQGYVEGEFVYVASPFAGQLDTLSVFRGQQARVGDALFTLDNTLEKAAVDEADRRLAQATASLEDAKKGKRPSEIESTQAQLGQARAALAFSEAELARVEGLKKTGAVSQQAYDQDRANRDQDLQRVTQLEADLKTAQLGQRADQIAAAEEEVKARRASLAQAQWNLSQKHQDAPKPGLVFDTLYRQGEWVEAGHPVVVLLPPENVKVRAFVSERAVGSLQVGESVQVAVDGVSAPYSGKISFISRSAEYTPPVIYSNESRDKLVFMIEVRFDHDSAPNLHPGQPVDVLLGNKP